MINRNRISSLKDDLMELGFADLEEDVEEAADEILDEYEIDEDEDDDDDDDELEETRFAVIGGKKVKLKKRSASERAKARRSSRKNKAKNKARAKKRRKSAAFKRRAKKRAALRKKFGLESVDVDNQVETEVEESKVASNMSSLVEQVQELVNGLGDDVVNEDVERLQRILVNSCRISDAVSERFDDDDEVVTYFGSLGDDAAELLKRMEAGEIDQDEGEEIAEVLVADLVSGLDEVAEDLDEMLAEEGKMDYEDDDDDDDDDDDEDEDED